MERPWPLTGRDEELRRVAAAIRPGAAGIVVAGPGRGGQDPARPRGVAGSRRQGSDRGLGPRSAAARPFPLGAFAGMVDVPTGHAAETIGRALDQLAQQQRPLVLAVDDAHLLDEHSAIVLHRVVLRRLAPVVVTLRTGEPAPDTVTSLWKDDHLPRLDLGPLDARRDHRPGRPGARRSGRDGLRAPVVDPDPGQPSVPAAPAGRRGVRGPVHPGIRDLAMDQRAGDLPGAGRPPRARDRRPRGGGAGRRGPGGTGRAGGGPDVVRADLACGRRGGRGPGPGAHRRAGRPAGPPAVRRGPPRRHGQPARPPPARPGGADPGPGAGPDPPGRAHPRLRPPPGPALFLQAAEAATRMYDLPWPSGWPAPPPPPATRSPGWCTPQPCRGSAAATRPRRSSRTSPRAHPTPGRSHWCSCTVPETCSSRWPGPTRPARRWPRPRPPARPRSTSPRCPSPWPLRAATSLPSLARGPELLHDRAARRPGPHPGRLRGVRGGCRHRGRGAARRSRGRGWAHRRPRAHRHPRVRARGLPGARAPPRRDTGPG